MPEQTMSEEQIKEFIKKNISNSNKNEVDDSNLDNSAKEFTKNVILNLPSEDEVEFEKTSILDEPIPKNYKFEIKIDGENDTKKFTAPSEESIKNILLSRGVANYTIISKVDLENSFESNDLCVKNLTKAVEQELKELQEVEKLLLKKQQLNNLYTYYKCDGEEYRICKKTGKLQKLKLVMLDKEITKNLIYNESCIYKKIKFENDELYEKQWVDLKLVVTI